MHHVIAASPLLGAPSARARVDARGAHASSSLPPACLRRGGDESAPFAAGDERAVAPFGAGSAERPLLVRRRRPGVGRRRPEEGPRLEGERRRVDGGALLQMTSVAAADDWPQYCCLALAIEAEICVLEPEGLQAQRRKRAISRAACAELLRPPRASELLRRRSGARRSGLRHWEATRRGPHGGVLLAGPGATSACGRA